MIRTAKHVGLVYIEISLLVHQSTGSENQKEQHKAGDNSGELANQSWLRTHTYESCVRQNRR